MEDVYGFDKNFPKTESRFCVKLRNFWKTEIYEISRFGNFQDFDFYVVKFAQKLKFSGNWEQIFEKLSKILRKLSSKNAKTEIYEISRHLISLDGVKKSLSREWIVYFHEKVKNLVLFKSLSVIGFSNLAEQLKIC